MRFCNPLFLQLAASAAAAKFHKRQDDDSFKLYAYGEEIGGLPLISTGTFIYIGSPESLNNTQAAPIIFTADSDGTWHGSPDTNATNGDVPTWTDLNLAVPAEASSSHDVVLVNGTSTDDVVSSGFGSYGKVAYLFSPNDEFISLWSAVPTDMDSVWTLEWNHTDPSTGAVPVTIKSTAPSTDA